MNTPNKQVAGRFIRVTSKELHDMHVMAEELDLKLCYPENFLTLRMIVQMKWREQEPSPKTSTDMGLLIHFYKNFDKTHWSIQWITYMIGIAAMVVVLVKYF